MSLLGKNYSNNDMKFEWINKDNILGVYRNFVTTVITKKDRYPREDWDEIKVCTTLYTLNRMGVKSEGNAKAIQ